MRNNPTQWFNDMLPRKTVYWRGGAAVTNIEIKRLKTDAGWKRYIIGQQTGDGTPMPISDFSLLAEILQIGELFSDFIPGKVDEEQYIFDHKEQIKSVLNFVEKYGFPNIAEELTTMPVHEVEREKILFSASPSSWLNSADLWCPLDGCSLVEMIVASSSLYRIWSTWVAIQERAAQDPTRARLIEILNQQLSHAGGTFQIDGITLFHKPQLTHLLRFNQHTKQYNDYYESTNLFNILFDQLYSFVADYDKGYYPRAKECPHCGKGFLPKRNQKYCCSCRDIIAAKKNIARNKRWRERHPEDYKRNQERYIETRRNKGG